MCNTSVKNKDARASTKSRTSSMGRRESKAGRDVVLTPEERQYLIYIQRGDVASVKKYLDQDRPPAFLLDVDCVDPIGRSAIGISIENENIDMLEALLERGVQAKDGLLAAISEEYVDGVEMLLHWEEQTHQPGEPYSWETVSHDSAAYTKDITPLVLAAHRNNYEILKLLLDRGATLPMPHDVRCGCDECLLSMKEDSLRHSLSRINAYKALASPSLIALSSKDPLLTAFELSSELNRLEGVEHEFKGEYMKLQLVISEFCKDLLDETRTHTELATILNYSPGTNEPLVIEEGAICSLDRLKLAIKYNQKQFVAHPNVQQFLGAIWYNGLPGFRRLTAFAQLLAVLKIAITFPILSMTYIISPECERSQFMKKPFVKFICQSGSYFFFLSLLTLASQRIEVLLLGWFGNDQVQEILAGWRERERGSIPGPIEFLVMSYVFGFIWAEIKVLWEDGLLEYVQDLWNIIDFTTFSFYMAWIQLRMVSWWVVHRDLWWTDNYPYYPREEWHDFDPMLLAEGCFGAAMVFSFLKLVHIFSVNPHMGPLQVSLGRMIFDILKFFFLYTLVLFAFGCGLIQLMSYYSTLESKKCYHREDGLPDFVKFADSCIAWRRFTNLFETSQSLFWASFGILELGIFELEGIGSFTRFWAMLMFGGYSAINIIVLLNLLIAMMSNSYTIIADRADMEWKFARTKLWLGFFEDGSTVPVPFNLIPTMKSVNKLMGKHVKVARDSVKLKNRRRADQQHMDVLRLIIRRYITQQQREGDERKVTDDDVNEIKQDISSFRFQLVDILKNSGMNTSLATGSDDPTVIGRKGRAMERQLMKGFNISKVEGILESVVTDDKKGGKNFFSNLAKAMNRKSKKDWNSKASRSGSGKRDQIGSSRQSINRSQTSMKRRIDYENDQLLRSMNPDQIAEYNPNLQVHTDHTKIAYAKFKVGTIRADKIKKQAEVKGDSVTVEKETKPFKPKDPNGVSKAPKDGPKASVKKVTSAISNVKDPSKQTDPNKKETDPQPEKPAAPSVKPKVIPEKVGETSKTNDGPPKKPEDQPKKPTDPPKEDTSKSISPKDQPKKPTDPPKEDTSKSISPKATEEKKPTPKPAPPKPAKKADDAPPFNPNGKSATTGKPVKGWL